MVIAMDVFLLVSFGIFWKELYMRILGEKSSGFYSIFESMQYSLSLELLGLRSSWEFG